MGAWSGRPICAREGCGRKKSPGQRDKKYCLTCERATKKAQSKTAHGKRVEATYGITEEDYWALYEFQGGRCFICRWARGKSRRLCVDHDHSCGRGHAPEFGCEYCIRGLLCKFCNTLIGRVRDAIDFFERAIEYLKSPPYQRLRELRRKDVS